MSPLIAFAVLGADHRSTAEQPCELQDLWGTAARDVHERLLATTSWSDRAAIVQSAFEVHRAAERSVDPEVAAAWDSIVRTHGTVQINQLVDQSGWSRKRLWSRFSAQIGLSPKRAAMLTRFDHASKRLAAGCAPADVAAACGYVVQSHLHRDLMSFARCTPRQLTAAASAPVAE
jgi:methylphosphotriester-DNA--protein-cysteine methyltransferase